MATRKAKEPVSLPSKIIGLQDIRQGEETGEISLRNIFKIASRNKCEARLLRLGGPKKFRADVINITDEKGNLTPGYKLLLNRDIKEIEFILSNPFTEQFLARMDQEGKNNWEIWRVCEQVISFVRGLLRASETRATHSLNKIRVAFHCADLIWNLDIAGNKYVVARAYFGTSTGHDKYISELHLRAGSPSKLAESFLTYYNSIKKDSQTRFIGAEADIKSIRSWPSLFKSNAILNPSDQSSDGVEKSCKSYICQKAEEEWLSFRTEEAPFCEYFHPVRLVRITNRTEPWSGQTFCLHQINGLTAAELLWHLQKIGVKHPDLIPKLQDFIGLIIQQALFALLEFRRVAKNIKRLQIKMRKYPWAQRLNEAILEGGKFVVDDQKELTRCIQELVKLGRELENHATEPFRDAHLKNRLIVIDPALIMNNYAGIIKKLHEIPMEDLNEWLKKKTFDIDFETSLYRVTSWDDPLHVLMSNGTGWTEPLEFIKGKGLLATWWCSPQDHTDENSLWSTLLCRSIREYCRRLWYANVMPITYKRRYYMERRDYFLHMSHAASKHIDGLTAIKEFLEKCYMHSKTAQNFPIIQQYEEPVRAQKPTFPKVHEKTVAFVSYSQKDKEFVSRMVADLKKIGLTIWWDKEILVGVNVPASIDKALKTAKVAILVLSKNSVNSEWAYTEWMAALNQAINRGSLTLIPIVIDKNVEIPPLIASIKYIDFTDPKHYETGLTQIINRIRKETGEGTVKKIKY